MDARFTAIHNHPSNSIFSIVFFPDRIYHAQYLNATRSPRYRYNVTEVRSKIDLQILKGEVYLDGEKISNFLRVEYRAARLIEQTRERGRFLTRGCVAWLRLSADGTAQADARVRLEYCPWIDAYQAEVWETLEAPPGRRHDWKVAQMMGRDSSITRIPAFNPALADIRALRRVEAAVREDYIQSPSGFSISDSDASWDNYYKNNIQVPNTQAPSSDQNTVQIENYLIDFQRNFFFANASDLMPVRYRNAMMEPDHPRHHNDNIIEMRWILQRELGSDTVFFHEVTIPPGKTEGTHQHIGSEELYYICEGEGIAQVGENDDPALAGFPVVEEPLFGLGVRKLREVPVRPGSVIFTKSGGIHGIRNPDPLRPLKFVAFLYQTA
jgi:mannose-6-phosphate isomerase-like protein (cupin superfamily)